MTWGERTDMRLSVKETGGRGWGGVAGDEDGA